MMVNLAQTQLLPNPESRVDGQSFVEQINETYRRQIIHEYTERLLNYLVIESETQGQNVKLSAQAVILNSNDLKELKTVLMSLIRRADLEQNDPLFLKIKNLLS